MHTKLQSDDLRQHLEDLDDDGSMIYK